MPQTSESPQAVAAGIAARLEATWNAADAVGFAAEFTPDADFVNVRGDYASGRGTIEAAHAHIWSTIYAGSTIRYSVARCRQLAPGTLIAHLDAHLRVPSGPLAGEIHAIPSLVLVQTGDRWQIAAFHNTPRSSR